MAPFSSEDDFRITWTLAGAGWADGIVEGRGTKAEFTASYLPSGPEALLDAVARLVAGEAETRAQFEAEPTAYRWIFYRQGDDVWLRLLELRHGKLHDDRGTEIWSGPLRLGVVARAVLRCFDQVVRAYGESGYRGKWGEHFPRAELEALRGLWRSHPGGGPA